MKTHWYEKEWLIVAAIWVAVFAASPLYMYYAHAVGSFEVRWNVIYTQWAYLVLFLILFLVHHFLIIPKTIPSKQFVYYAISVIVCLVIFAFALDKMGIAFPEHHVHPRDGNPPPMFLLPPPDLGRVIAAFLMLVADLGAVAWINENQLQQRLLLLEKQTLKHELMQLRYQINPHFFMNTLNNIHALVDIDQERAKRAIVELSGMMRYSLYEGNSPLTPLQHEVEFLQLYISLMKLRFSNKVELICDFPESTPAEVMMPPLLLATFIENAFKHGISYQKASFIYVTLKLEDDNSKIHFRCVNSRHVASTTNDGHHGIGLVNVRKRLDLQYTNGYKLIIDDNNRDQFAVDLFLPTN